MTSLATESPVRQSSAAAPPCTRMGAQCRALSVTLRVGSLEDGPTSLDHEATWLLGHTERITFGELWESEGDLYVDAVLHVGCRHLYQSGGNASCRAHGFQGRLPHQPRSSEQPRRLGRDRFQMIESMQVVQRRLQPPAVTGTPARSLPVLTADNPCAGAPCRTSDNRRGAACCRDLQIEIMCAKSERRLEALVRSRRSPYLCKVEREGDFSLDAEMISACGYLADDGVACSLHGRTRADGRPAKPDLCTEWPPKGRGLHPGCVFGPRSRKGSRRPS
jgi:hypothetical protein